MLIDNREYLWLSNPPELPRRAAKPPGGSPFILQPLEDHRLCVYGELDIAGIPNGAACNHVLQEALWPYAHRMPDPCVKLCSKRVTHLTMSVFSCFPLHEKIIVLTAYDLLLF